MDPLTLGILGCGSIVKMHVRHLDRTPVRATCVMDVRAEAARTMGERLGCDWTTDRAALLARGDVDAVLIATPNCDHADSALAALAAGKHVLCEKPIVKTLDEGVAVVRAARAAKTIFQTAFMRRCHPAYAELRRQVREQVGEIQNVRIRNLGACPGETFLAAQSDPAWLEASGGHLVVSGCHSLDVMRWILGEPDTILAKVRSWGALASEAYTTAALDYGAYQVFWEYGLHRIAGLGEFGTGWEDVWEVTGENARVTLSMPDWDRYEQLRPILRIRHADGRSEQPEMPTCDYYEMQLNRFAENVAAGRASPDAIDGFRAQAIVEAMRASSETGRSVAVEAFYHRAE